MESIRCYHYLLLTHNICWDFFVMLYVSEKLEHSQCMWEISTDLSKTLLRNYQIDKTWQKGIIPSDPTKNNLLLPHFLINEEILSHLPWYLWPCRTLNESGKDKASPTLAFLTCSWVVLELIPDSLCDGKYLFLLTLHYFLKHRNGES